MKLKEKIAKYIDIHFPNNTHYLILFNRILKVNTVWLEKNSPQGRFGGGWTTKASLLIGGDEFAIELFLLSIRSKKLYLEMPWRNKVYTKIQNKGEYRRLFQLNTLSRDD